MKGCAASILDGFATSFTAPQKAVRGSSSAFLLNLAILSRQEPLGTDLNTGAVSALVHQLGAIPQDDADAISRFGLLFSYTASSTPHISQPGVSRAGH